MKNLKTIFVDATRNVLTKSTKQKPTVAVNLPMLVAELEKSFGQPRLTVELVPRTCWFSNVRDHVDKKIWDSLRKPTYQKAHYVCEVCGGRGSKWPVECHEIWYYDDQNYIQKLTGLTALCPSCHEVKHIGLSGLRGMGEAAKTHLAEVNGWTEEQVDEYLDRVWKIWRERSQYQWKVDFAWLEQFGIKIESKRKR